MKRSAFVAAATAALIGSAERARATGGLDVDQPVTPHEMRVLLASAPGIAPPVEILDGFSFRYGGRAYRGRAQTAVLADGRMGLIDAVPLDAYLYSVVNKELSARWPAAALQAQAIVARTYALTKHRLDRPYDVVAGQSDQVYGGFDAESVEARAAVDATAGTIVAFGPAPAKVAFGSCCGGHTADAQRVWGSALPYLRGVADPYCAGAPEFHWERDVPYDALQRAFGAQLASAGDLQRIDLRDVDDTGRPSTVALVGARSTFEMKASAFRLELGTSLVRSTMLKDVRVERGGDGGTVVITGSGNGHGVGFCQWGAHGMADAGADAATIVRFYFPETTLARA